MGETNQARTALLVDDSKSARFVLGKLLKGHDFEVEMVDSAEAALSFLESQRPDAIFMDHMMPGMDGLSATSAIKNNPQTSHIPVVMCTSNDGEQYQKEARSHGALATLQKPPGGGAAGGGVDGSRIRAAGICLHGNHHHDRNICGIVH